MNAATYTTATTGIGTVTTITVDTTQLMGRLATARLQSAQLAAMYASAKYGRTPIYDQLRHAYDMNAMVERIARTLALVAHPGTCRVDTCAGTPGQPCTLPDGTVRPLDHKHRQGPARG